jgi:L-fucose isomerase-like protein
MRGKSFLSLGGISMGIAGSLVDQSLFEGCLGMRVEAVDMTEFVRRINREIFEPVRITGRFISSIKVITQAIGDLPIMAEQLRIK